MRQGERSARWASWAGDTIETLHVGWESGGWTADGRISEIDVHYALRFDAAWRIRQVMLFRDLEEPDLWLATDGSGRWGEVHGVEREDLAGCEAVLLPGSPFPLAALTYGFDDEPTGEVVVADLDVETLGLVPRRLTWEAAGERTWRVGAHVVVLDDDGLPLDIEGAFRRLP